MNVIAKRVTYLAHQSEQVLKNLYFMSEFEMYEIDEEIFSFGQDSNSLLIIMQGVVEIDLTNGIESKMLDLLGRGSVIGVCNVLNREQWVFNAVAKSVMSTVILRIPFSVISVQMESNPRLKLSINQTIKDLETKGIPQVDYLMHNDIRAPDFVYFLMHNFKKYKCWLTGDTAGIKRLSD